MLKTERYLLVITAVLLCLIGTFFIYNVGATASLRLPGVTDANYLIKRQLLHLVIAGVVCWLGAMVDVKLYHRFPYLLYGFALVLLTIPLISGLGRVSHGAQRWTSIFGQSVQLSELAKFCLVAFFAYLTSKTNHWQVFLTYLVPPIALMLLQSDLGGLLIMSAAIGGMYFLAGAPWRVLVTIGILGIAGVVIISSFGFRSDRIEAFLHPDEDLGSTGHHVYQSKIAIGRGGFLGQGIGQSQQKFTYLPEVHTDSIFAIIGEETGFAGVGFIFLVYIFFLYLIWRIIQIAALDVAQKLLGYGIFIIFLSQIFVNLGAISGLIPLTGLTLPFISYGGSSLVTCMFLVGVVINLAKQQPAIVWKRRKYV